jgi:hypothetical protein
MRKIQDGDIYGRLKVLSKDQNKVGYYICECQCEEHKIKSVRGSHLTAGRIKSCGCLYKERTKNWTGKTQIIEKEDYCIGITDDKQIFYFDYIDKPLVEKYNWYTDFDGYIVTRIDGKGVKLHKLILDNNDSIVDHVFKKRYDNRRQYLRYVTNSENSFNCKLHSNNQSGITGVGWQRRNNKWRARITHQGETVWLGQYDNFDDAVKARKEAEKLYYPNQPLSK